MAPIGGFSDTGCTGAVAGQSEFGYVGSPCDHDSTRHTRVRDRLDAAHGCCRSGQGSLGSARIYGRGPVRFRPIRDPGKGP